MDKAIDDLDSNNQGIFMGVVHRTRIGFSKDDVVWLWRVAYWGLGASCVHHGLRWFLRFLCICVSRTSATPDLLRSPKYHQDLSSFRYMAGVSPYPRGNPPTWASNFGD